jgi:hypothetical protein
MLVLHLFVERNMVYTSRRWCQSLPAPLYGAAYRHWFGGGKGAWLSRMPHGIEAFLVQVSVRECLQVIENWNVVVGCYRPDVEKAK